MPSNTRERLLEASTELFYRNGFQAVGLDRILAEVGISKTAFYKHFECKDDLIVEVLRHRDGQDIAECIEFMHSRGGTDPTACVLAFFDLLGEWFGDPDFRGCLFMNAATEFPSPHDPIHQTAAMHTRHLSQEFFRLLAMSRAPRPDLLTRQLMLLIAGAIAARHVSGALDAAACARAVAQEILRPIAPLARAI